MEIFEPKVCSILSKSRLVILVIPLFLSLIAQIYLSWACFPNVDEAAHLPAGISHWKTGQFELFQVNPPLVRTVAAIGSTHLPFDWTLLDTAVGVRSEFDIGRASIVHHRLGVQSWFFMPRLLCLPMAMLGSFLLVYWAAHTLGFACGLALSAYLACSPSMLASGSTICPDACAVSLGIVTSFAAYCYLKNPSIKRASIAGLALGLAILTKLTWLTGVFSIPLTAVVCIKFIQFSPSNRGFGKFLADFLVFQIACLCTINSGYLFQGTGKPLRDFQFCSRALGGPNCDKHHLGNRFSDSWLGNIPVPLPANLVRGVDYLRMEVEMKAWSFLDGQWKLGSWPHYYLMSLLYKTPIGTLVAALLGLSMCLLYFFRCRSGNSDMLMMVCSLSLPAAICFLAISWQGGFNHHHRYMLMVYPAIHLIASIASSRIAMTGMFGSSNARLSRRFAVASALMLFGTIVESSMAFPNTTGFFNRIAGGPLNGWHHLGFSNVEWGQDLHRIKDWIDENPECSPLRFELNYFDFNGNLFELPDARPIRLPLNPTHEELKAIHTDTAEWWIVSVNSLYNRPGEFGLQYLQNFEPVDKIANCYLVYYIDKAM